MSERGSIILAIDKKSKKCEKHHCSHDSSFNLMSSLAPSLVFKLMLKCQFRQLILTKDEPLCTAKDALEWFVLSSTGVDKPLHSTFSPPAVVETQWDYQSELTLLSGMAILCNNICYYAIREYYHAESKGHLNR